jgi:hypothetical protein
MDGYDHSPQSNFFIVLGSTVLGTQFTASTRPIVTVLPARFQASTAGVLVPGAEAYFDVNGTTRPRRFRIYPEPCGGFDRALVSCDRANYHKARPRGWACEEAYTNDNIQIASKYDKILYSGYRGNCNFLSCTHTRENSISTCLLTQVFLLTHSVILPGFSKRGVGMPV